MHKKAALSKFYLKKNYVYHCIKYAIIRVFSTGKYGSEKLVFLRILLNVQDKIFSKITKDESTISKLTFFSNIAGSVSFKLFTSLIARFLVEFTYFFA